MRLLIGFLILFGCTKINAQTQNNYTASDELKILSWNIYMLPSVTNLSKRIQKSSKVKRAKAIAKWVSQHNYHIIVWQETFHHRSRHVLKRKLKKQYPYQYGPANKQLFPLATSSGITIFSTFKMEKLKEHRYRTKVGVDAMAKKGFLALEGDWQGQTFQILGTHLQAEGPDENRLKQMDEIVENFIKPFKKQGVPQILCGDMNTEKSGKSYQKMIDKFGVEAYRLDSELQRTNAHSEIDYIFVKPNGAKINDVKCYSIIPEMEWGKNGEKWLSDHYAIDARIKF